VPDGGGRKRGHRDKGRKLQGFHPSTGTKMAIVTGKLVEN
jgi:hypothetical protein